MDAFIDSGKTNKGTKKIFIVAVVLGLLAVVGIAVGVYILPSPEEEKQAVLKDVYREGSKQFDEYHKQIIISNDPKQLIEQYTGLGDIIMRVGGKIRNKGDKSLTGLEVSVGMINTKNELIKDKKVLVVPQYHAELKPGEAIDFTVNIPGFSYDDDRANARWKVTAIKFKEQN